tara:strand:+ start:1375 stop:1713 length:339 start_codon:yes stop_codon:yes gene_type:complete
MSNLIYTHNHYVPRLFSKIVEWAQDRNLINGATSKDQCLKLVQEVGELSDSLCKKKSPIDDIGDCIVCLTILAEQQGLTMQECIEHAYNDIKDRKGTMIDGVFVKDSDLTLK